MKAIIMAAGKSTRAYPLTLTRPKSLLKICNRTILEHQMDALHGLVDSVILVVGYKREMIRNAFGDEYKGMPLEYVEQTEQLGTGHAILQCAARIDGPFLAMNGDDLYDPADIARLAQARAAALVKRVPNPELFGIFKTTENGRVIRLVEKPQQPFSNLANVGVYAFTPEIFDVLAKTERSERGEIEITSAIQTLATAVDFHTIEMGGYWLPIGFPWNVLDATEFLIQRIETRIDGDVSPRAELNGAVQVGLGAEIRSGVVIDGPVIVGANASIGPNCWIRPGCVIGDGARVGHAVELKNSVLMDGAKVPHLSYVGDSVIGEDANFGAGTITANLRHDDKNVFSQVKGDLIDSGRRKLGAIVGDHVHTGINTCIYPGRKLWPNTSTRPGEVVQKDIVS